MIKRWFVCLLITAFFNPAAFGISLEDALNMERRGDTEAAREAYILWLEENSRTNGAADVLVHASTLGRNPVSALGLLKQFVDNISRDDAYPVYARIAALEEMLGLLGPAAINYERAASAGGVQGERWLLKSLAIQFSMGDFNRVKTAALGLVENGKTIFIRDEALAFASASQARLGDEQGALERIISRTDSVEVFPVASSLLWLTLMEIAEAQGRSDLIRKASRSLQNDFPSSAGSYLSQSRILYWESPSMLLEPSRLSTRYSLQVGVFQNRDGAASLRMQLENDGFTAWLEEERELWRVLVNDADGSTASQLAAKGYEALIRR